MFRDCLKKELFSEFGFLLESTAVDKVLPDDPKISFRPSVLTVNPKGPLALSGWAKKKPSELGFLCLLRSASKGFGRVKLFLPKYPL